MNNDRRSCEEIIRQHRISGSKELFLNIGRKMRAQHKECYAKASSKQDGGADDMQSFYNEIPIHFDRIWLDRFMARHNLHYLWRCRDLLATCCLDTDKNMLAHSVRTGEALPARYHTLFRTWFVLGWPAFIGLVVIFFLMVFKPV